MANIVERGNDEGQAHLTEMGLLYEALVPVLYGDGFTLVFQPAFHIDRGAAAIAGGGNGLAIAMIGNVASGKDARDVGHRMFDRHDIADLIHIDDALEELSIWLMADRQEDALHRQVHLFARSRVADAHARHGILGTYRGDESALRG